MMGKLIVFFVFCIFLQSSFALSISANRQAAEKGEEVQFFGACNDKVEITAFEGERELFSQTANCIANNYILAKIVPMNFPAGEWKIVAKSLDEKEQAFLEVRHSRESAFLLLVFQKPETKKFFRKQKAEITVEITDAGKPVENAVVNFWGANGKIMQLTSAGKGFYTAEHEIHFDERLGKFQLAVAAEAEKNGARFGGESSTEISVEKAVIEIELLEPKHRTIHIGEKTGFAAKALYNGTEGLIEPTLVLYIGDKNFLLEKENGLFSSTTQIEDRFRGKQVLKIVAIDSAGNTGEKSYNVVVQDNPLALISTLLIVGVVVLVALFLFWPIFLGIAGQKAEQKQLRKKRVFLEKNINELQKRYYEGRVKDKQYYKQKLSEMRQELTEANAKLKKDNQQ